ncbi:hypothetical protein C8J44_0043 [Sphingomonas sp. PP-CE-3A-406]|uniref:ankyrin repeat domain-containing protein n=1 Tax=Sphingomonas sp. PP-CE-3A-406 TaxID=2135659 RepID=UPI000F2529B9|nr:ankyrin repeat domain-containing protein [Sphingomonas sp. PP-CE-3A-406]RMB54817.1 hypothetical protein C8J44_0043 [Sphingomonas sp. PP-CE-3A-406]
MIRLLPITTLVGFALLAACFNEDASVNQAAIMPMLGAVMHSDTDEVRRLAEHGIGLDEREPADQSTPMIVASGSDQWPVVEILVDHGADIWAHDQFGVTMAQMAVTSRILPGSDEDKARLRVIEKLKARGYPFPPPNAERILSLEKDGKWPPLEATR